MAGFARIAKWLGLAFPESGTAHHNPSQLTDVVQLVSFFPAGPEELWLPIRILVTSAAGTNFIDASPVPAGKFWYVPVARASHNDPAAREVHVSIFGLLSGVQLEVPIVSQNATPTNILLPINRSVIIPPGFNLRGSTDAIAVANTVTLNGWAFEYTLGQESPRL